MKIVMKPKEATNAICTSPPILIALLCLLTACPTSTPPAELTVTPLSVNMTAGDAPAKLTAELTNSSATLTWSLTGEGSLSATSGKIVQYVPPTNLSDPQVATVLVRAGSLSRTVAIAIKPRPDLFVTQRTRPSRRVDQPSRSPLISNTPPARSRGC
jgi:hypothetical protein